MHSQDDIDGAGHPGEAAARVLVVEDEALIRLDVCSHLRECGYQVIEAANGEEASRILLSGLAIDLVFTDVHMPGRVDGVDLARWIHTTRPHIPIIVASGTPDVAAKVANLCEGAVFVAKPYEAAVVARRIRDALSSAGI